MTNSNLTNRDIANLIAKASTKDLHAVSISTDFKDAAKASALKKFAADVSSTAKRQNVLLVAIPLKE